MLDEGVVTDHILMPISQSNNSVLNIFSSKSYSVLRPDTKMARQIGTDNIYKTAQDEVLQ
jgi:hypothetical protein